MSWGDSHFDRGAYLVDYVNKDLIVNGVRRFIDCFNEDLLGGPQLFCLWLCPYRLTL